jgi:hypothetical protein
MTMSACSHPLVVRWRDDAGVLRRRGQAAAAELLEGVAEELETWMRTQPRPIEIPLTPAQAAQVSGYSADHIRRMLASGHWRNVGTAHTPRILRTDLPTKRSANAS